MPRKGTHHRAEARRKIREARAQQWHPSFVKRGITPEIVEAATTRGLRWCTGKCKAFVPKENFYSARVKRCRECVRGSVQAFRAALTPEERQANSDYLSSWRIEQSEKVRRHWLKRQYAVTPEWYERKLADQGGHCALCPAVVDERKLANNCLVSKRRYLLVDHDHETGEARGLLCAKCNTALHRVESVLNWAGAAVAYLERYELKS